MAIAVTTLGFSTGIARLTANKVTLDLPWIPVANNQLQMNLIVKKDTPGVPVEHMYDDVYRPPVSGTAADDLMLLGNWQTRLINAGNGNDTIIYHDGGLSYMQGAWGNPKPIGAIYGGAGDDRISGSEAGDILSGGAGFDRLMYCWSIKAVQVNLDTGTASGGSARYDVISGFEGLWGSFYNDALTGNAGANELRGLAGNDTLVGLEGNDTLLGETGNDRLWGHLGDDQLSGGAGNDALWGASGRDWLNGGAGSDTLSGGANEDRFVFVKSTLAERDLISDFTDNVDTLALKGMGVTSFAQLRGHASVINGDDLLLSFGNQSLVLANFSIAQLADDVIFA